MNTSRKDSTAVQWKIRVLFALVLIIGLFAYPSPVLACSCGEAGSPADSLVHAGAIFTGVVTRIRESDYSYRVYFAVTRSWKGVSKRTTSVYTGTSAFSCSYPFHVGVSYLVYAVGEPNEWYVNICGRTAEVSQAAEDLSYLDTIDPIFVASTSQFPWLQADIIALIATGVLLILALGWRLRRQRRTPS